MSSLTPNQFVLWIRTAYEMWEADHQELPVWEWVSRHVTQHGHEFLSLSRGMQVLWQHQESLWVQPKTLLDAMTVYWMSRIEWFIHRTAFTAHWIYPRLTVAQNIFLHHRLWLHVAETCRLLMDIARILQQRREYWRWHYLLRTSLEHQLPPHERSFSVLSRIIWGYGTKPFRLLAWMITLCATEILGLSLTTNLSPLTTSLAIFGSASTMGPPKTIPPGLSPDLLVATSWLGAIGISLFTVSLSRIWLGPE